MTSDSVLTCSICRQRFGANMFHVTTGAGHVFCEICLFTAMRTHKGQLEESGWIEELEEEK